jgi:hypothetical protein
MVVSFRFTCRNTDNKFVMNRTFPREADGKIRLLDSKLKFDAAITPYDEATAPAYDTIVELFRNIKEVNDIVAAREAYVRYAP